LSKTISPYCQRSWRQFMLVTAVFGGSAYCSPSPTSSEHIGPHVVGLKLPTAKRAASRRLQAAALQPATLFGSWVARHYTVCTVGSGATRSRFPRRSTGADAMFKKTRPMR